MSGPRTARVRPALALLAILASAALAQDRVPGPAPVRIIDGVPCVGLNDFARLLDGAKFGRADLRKVVVRAGRHRFTFTAGVPLALIDDRSVRLDAPVTSAAGEFQIPVSFLAALPADSSLARLVVDARNTRVRVVPAGGWVGAPRVTVTGERTRVSFATDRPGEAVVVSRARGHFRVRVPGRFDDTATDSLPAGSLVRTWHPSAAPGATVFEFALAPEAGGFRLEGAGRALALEFGRAGADLERFAPEGPAGPRALRVVVLDAGHGGADDGVRVGDTAEKDLTLALARVLASELEHRGVRVVLTRDADRAVPADERAEAANRARADVVLSLHFDGFAGSRARGASVWCAPAAASERGAGAGVITLTPWRDVGDEHAADSRALADALADALNGRSLGPARVRERLAAPLLGVAAPAAMVECATLTSPDDLARVATPEGLRECAGALVEGLLAWQRHE